MLVRVLFLIGMLLSLSACRSQSVSSQRNSQTATNQVATVTDAPVSSPIMTALVKRPNLTPVKSPTGAAEIVEKALDTPMTFTESLTITIVYDNNHYDLRLNSAWGFSALVEYRDHTLLFDTGGDGSLLMENMHILGIDPAQIESIMLSHAHGDHTDGLSALLEAGFSPVVYLLPSFPQSFKRQVGRITEVVEVTPGLSIAEGIFTTGEMGRNIPEQALVIKTGQGLVVITGCAHPGIVEILEQVRAMFAGPVHLVLGGFHLGSKSKAEIDSILKDFRRLEVERVGPCHCTGDNAISKFSIEYGENFIQTGVGKTIRMEAINP